MTIVIRPSSWYQNFSPNGLSAPTLGLCINFFSAITADFNKSSSLRWAIQDQWSSGLILFYYSPALKKWGLYWICLVIPEFCGSVILSFRHSVIIQVKLEYLWGQLANVDQILYEASLGWGKGCIRFWDRLDQNSGFHGNWKRPLTYNGENDFSTFSGLFLIWFFLYLQVTRTCIRSRISSNFGQFGPLTMELAALEHLKISHRLIMGKWCLQASLFNFYRIFVKLAGNQDRHKISDEFEFRLDRISHFGVTCPCGQIKLSIDILSNLKVQMTCQTLEFFVTLFLGTVRPRRLKLGTQVGSGQMYHVYWNQAAATYSSLYFFIFLSLQFSTLWFFITLFSETLKPRRLKLGTHVDSGQVYQVYQNQAAAAYSSLYFFIFLSLQFSTLKFFVIHSSRTVRLRRLKIDTHVDNEQMYRVYQNQAAGRCIMYTRIRLLLLIHPFISSFIFLSNFQHWNFLSHFSQGGERGGSVVECRTPEREVGGSKPTAAVLCPWARHFTPRKYWLITQEAVAPSRHDWKIVDWDVKPQNKQTNFSQELWGLEDWNLVHT